MIVLDPSILELVRALSRTTLTPLERARIFDALGQDGRHEAVSVVIARALRGSVEDRITAVGTLGRLRHPAAREALRHLLTDPDGGVRLAAAAANAGTPRPAASEPWIDGKTVIAFPRPGKEPS